MEIKYNKPTKQSNLSLVATGAGDGGIAVWDYCTHTITADLVGHKTTITALAFLVRKFDFMISC